MCSVRCLIQASDNLSWRSEFSFSGTFIDPITHTTVWPLSPGVIPCPPMPRRCHTRTYNWTGQRPTSFLACPLQNKGLAVQQWNHTSDKRWLKPLCPALHCSYTNRLRQSNATISAITKSQCSEEWEELHVPFKGSLWLLFQQAYSNIFQMASWFLEKHFKGPICDFGENAI